MNSSPTSTDSDTELAGIPLAGIAGDVRRFRAASFDEALAAATDELGADIDVVEANRIRRGGLGGFFATDLGVEVIVTQKPPSERSRHVSDAVDRLLDRFGDDRLDRFVPTVDAHRFVSRPSTTPAPVDERTVDGFWGDVVDVDMDIHTPDAHPFADLLERELEAISRDATVPIARPTDRHRLGDEVDLVDAPSRLPAPELDRFIEPDLEFGPAVDGPIWMLDDDGGFDPTPLAGASRAEAPVTIAETMVEQRHDSLSELDDLLRQAGVDTRSLTEALALPVRDDSDRESDIDPGSMSDSRGAAGTPAADDRGDDTLPIPRIESASTDLVLQAADRLATHAALLDSSRPGAHASLRRMQVKITSPDGTQVEMSAEWGERGQAPTG